MLLNCSDVLAQNPAALHYGVCACDIDHDGRTEFIVAGFNGPNRVLKWSGSRLRDVAPPTLADPARRAIGLAAADVDGDGREELYVLNTDTYAGPKLHADRLWDARLDGTWHDLFDEPDHFPLRNLSAGRSVAAIDRRGTGRYSFFVANYGRPLRLYELSPGGRLSDVAPALGVNATVGGRGLLVAPLVSDRSDVFLVNEHGPNLLLRNTGLGTFLEVASEVGLDDPAEHGRGLTLIDRGGSQFGLCYGNWDGPHRLMLRRDDGRFRDAATPAMALPSLVRTVLAADLDNDGYEELFFNNIGEPNRLFRQTPAGEWHLADPGAALEPDGLGTGAAVADIDDDGRLELLVAHGESAAQPLSLYKTRANDNAWIRIQPLTRFAAPARGAVVRIRANNRVQSRVICGGSGYLCQMEPVAHFGLGPAPQIDEVQVTWPDGVTVTWPGLAVRQTHRLSYPTR